MPGSVAVYDRTFAKFSRPAIHPAVSRVLQELPRGRLHDMPSGSGALSYRLFKEGFDVVACDLFPENFEPTEIPVVRGDLRERFPFEDNSFDYATFVEGPEHAENPFRAFQEFARVLKPGGRLIVTLPNYTNIQSRLRYLFFGSVEKAVSQQRFRDQFHSVPAMLHISPLAYTQLRFFLEASGFVIDALHRDKRKWKQMLMLPATLALQGLSWTIDTFGEDKYWSREANAPVLLQGGNTLILVARKQLPTEN